MKLRHDYQNVRDIGRTSFAPHGNFQQNKTGDECNPVTGSNSNYANSHALHITKQPGVQQTPA